MFISFEVILEECVLSSLILIFEMFNDGNNFFNLFLICISLIFTIFCLPSSLSIIWPKLVLFGIIVFKSTDLSIIKLIVFVLLKPVRVITALFSVIFVTLMLLIFNWGFNSFTLFLICFSVGLSAPLVLNICLVWFFCVSFIFIYI